MPNFGLMYNPYTSPAWGYGLGPQFSTVRGSLASGLLFGGHPGIASLGGFGTGPLPYGPYSNYAFPGLSSSGYHLLGPYGRYPGSTGTLGFGSYQGYNVYTGMGAYPGVGPFGAFAPGDYDHYRNDPARQGDLASLGLNPGGIGGPNGVMPMASAASASAASASPSRDSSFGVPPSMAQQQQSSPLGHPMQPPGHGSMADASLGQNPPFLGLTGQQQMQPSMMTHGLRGPNTLPGSFMPMPPAYAPPSSSSSSSSSSGGNNYQSDPLSQMFAIPIGGRPDRADSRKMMMNEEETASSGIRESIGSPSNSA